MLRKLITHYLESYFRCIDWNRDRFCKRSSNSSAQELENYTWIFIFRQLCLARSLHSWLWDFLTFFSQWHNYLRSQFSVSQISRNKNPRRLQIVLSFSEVIFVKQAYNEYTIHWSPIQFNHSLKPRNAFIYSTRIETGSASSIDMSKTNQIAVYNNAPIFSKVIWWKQQRQNKK